MHICVFAAYNTRLRSSLNSSNSKHEFESENVYTKYYYGHSCAKISPNTATHHTTYHTTQSKLIQHKEQLHVYNTGPHFERYK